MSTLSPSEKTIFLKAIELSTVERQNFLDHACGADGRQRRHVEQLLAAHARTDLTVDQPAVAPALGIAEWAPAAGPGAQIGRYKLLEQIGEGGMGVVYMAEQTDPVLRRVALKIIKPGMDSRQVIARFEAERQALAMMDHANICKVLDGGSTELGHPFFVMELVRGLPITEFSNQRRLTTPDRLRLFVSVCQAVQHAHQKGIIHRDLKPNNVLVTMHDGVPVPKVIDFGVAKATNQRLTDKTLFTNFAHMIGSPSYMSPEQAEPSGEDIDTRSDVYSLGVMLYELLTGNLPFDRETIRQSNYEEVLRVIREQEPARPSVRVTTLQAAALSTVSMQRGCDPRTLGYLLRGELDWIVMKALEKDRSRRYESVSALAADIERYLDDEPVEACPPSVRYRLRKLVSRHKVALASTAVVATTLIVATVISSLMAIDATKARHLADQRFEEQQHAVERLQTALGEKNAALAREAKIATSVYPLTIASVSELVRERRFELADQLLALFTDERSKTNRRGFEWHYLWGHSHSSGRLLRGHTATVFSISFSPDGRQLASASGDDTVRIWDTATGQLEHVLIGHTNDVNGVAFSPNGKAVATASEDKTVGLWDPVKGDCLATLSGHSDMVNCPAYSQDGQILVSGSVDGELILWETKTRAEIARHQAHEGRIHALAVSPDGSRLASCASDQTVKVWELATLESVFSFECPNESSSLRSVVFQPGTQQLLAGFRDGPIRRWNTESGQRIDDLENDQYLLGLSFSTDGDELAVSGAESPVNLWRGREMRNAVYSQGHAVANWCVSRSPDGQFLVAGSDHDVVLWDRHDPPIRQLLASFPQEIGCMAVTPDCQSVFAGAADGNLYVLNIVTGEESVPIHAHAGGVTCPEYSPDGTILATGGHDRLVSIRDASMNREICTLPGFVDRVLDVAFSVDGRQLAACDGTHVHVWDATNWESVDKWQAHGIKFLEFTSTNGVLMGGVTVQYRTPGREVVSFPTPSGHGIDGMDINRDGSTAAFAFHRHMKPAFLDVRKFDEDSIGQLRLLDRNRNHGHLAAAISSDGKTVAAVDSRGHVALWDAETGSVMLRESMHEQTNLPDHFEKISLAFAPDDSALVFGLSPCRPTEETKKTTVIYVWHAPQLKTAKENSVPDVDGHLAPGQSLSLMTSQ